MCLGRKTRVINRDINIPKYDYPLVFNNNNNY